jgi:dihydroflavonol-4-reductase
MSVLVTGASGHVGANLIRTLVEKGHSTRCMVHVNCRAIDGVNCERVEADVRDPDSLSRAFKGVDVVYHLAAVISLSMADWPKLEAINVLGTRNVVQACLNAGVKRLIHFSSIHALTQEPFDVPVDENRPLSEAHYYPPYDRSKAAAEKEVLAGIKDGLDAVIVNPTAVFGPHDYQPSYFGEALLTMARGKLPAMVRGGFDWVDVRDVVAGAMLAEEKGKTGSRYLLSGHWVSMCDIAAMMEKITGVSNSKFVCPLWLAHAGAPFIKVACQIRGERPLYTNVSLKALKSNHHISHERATRELGYRPRPFRETLEDTLRWFQENGQLARSENSEAKQ